MSDEVKPNENLTPDEGTQQMPPVDEHSSEEIPMGPVDQSTDGGSDADSAAQPEDELETLKAQLADAEKRVLMAHADMENYRKRIAREKQDTIRNAAAKVVESLLPVLDNMKLGLQAAENHPEAKDVVTGFKMVDEQLKRSLEEQGLKELNPDGEIFDPNHTWQ